MYKRMPLHKIPGIPTFCDIEKPCVYRKSGVCEDPKCGKQNSDSVCHRMNNKDLFAKLRRMEDQSGDQSG